MSMFNIIDTAGSGMTAERLRMDVISNNLANASTTRTEDGGPYKRKVVNLAPRGEESESFDAKLEEYTNTSLPGSDSATSPSVGLGSTEGSDIGNGVRVKGIVEADGEPRRVYEPNHPDANEEGIVLKPNVEPVKEMVDMMSASKAYQANVTTIQTAKSMFQQAIRIAR
jgi:flagellar basal-body rod protein FlgC